jgi:hypothetical protein
MVQLRTVSCLTAWGLTLAGGASAADPVPPAAPWVDFRMTPIEQAKKIDAALRERAGGGVTHTVMAGWSGDLSGERQHLVVDASRATPAYVSTILASAGVDSVSWLDRGSEAQGACDSDAECRKKTEEMCQKLGNGGVKEGTVKVTVHVDGSKTCSGDCSQGGAVAFITCKPNG